MQNLRQRVMQWAFERLYHEFAWSYDLVAAAVSGGHWPRWIVSVVPWLSGEHVLELGCGTGHLQLALAQRAIRRIGYDASWPMLRLARRLLLRMGREPRLLRGYAQALPFPAATFSDVVATFPAPYIVHPTTLHEVRRVLRPGGQLTIVDGGRLVSAGPYEAAVDLAFRATGQSGGENRYEQALTAAGFAVEWRRQQVGPTTVAIIRARPSGPGDA